METVLLFILLGLGSGALIAGIGLGVVATYRGSGVINLSTGAIAMLGGYAFWGADQPEDSPRSLTAVALPLSLAFRPRRSARSLEFAVYRPLRNASPLGKLIASLGVLLIAQSSMLIAFGVTQQASPSVLPTKLIHMLGSGITLDRFILAGIVIAAAVVLSAVYKWTRFGLATRAASENEAARGCSAACRPDIDLARQHAARRPCIARALGILAATVTQLDPAHAAAADHPGAGRRADRLGSPRSASSAAASVRHRHPCTRCSSCASAQSWFPQSGGVALPGVDRPARVPHHRRRAVLARRRAFPGRGEVARAQPAPGAAPAAPVAAPR